MAGEESTRREPSVPTVSLQRAMQALELRIRNEMTVAERTEGTPREILEAEARRDAAALADLRAVVRARLTS